MNFERLTCGWRMRIGKVVIVWGRDNKRKYRFERGYIGWFLYCGRLIIGKL